MYDILFIMVYIYMCVCVCYETEIAHQNHHIHMIHMDDLQHLSMISWNMSDFSNGLFVIVIRILDTYS